MRRPLPQSTLLGKIVTVVVGGILLILGFMFSIVLLAIAAVVGLAAWAYFWWKTRALRKAMREQHMDGQVIDGEAIVINDPRAGEPRVLPDEGTEAIAADQGKSLPRP